MLANLGIALGLTTIFPRSRSRHRFVDTACVASRFILFPLKIPATARWPLGNWHPTAVCFTLTRPSAGLHLRDGAFGHRWGPWRQRRRRRWRRRGGRRGRWRRIIGWVWWRWWAVPIDTGHSLVLGKKTNGVAVTRASPGLELATVAYPSATDGIDGCVWSPIMHESGTCNLCCSSSACCVLVVSYPTRPNRCPAQRALQLFLRRLCTVGLLPRQQEHERHTCKCYAASNADAGDATHFFTTRTQPPFLHTE